MKLHNNTLVILDAIFHGCTTPSKIMEHCGLDSHTVSHHLSTLSKKNYIRRKSTGVYQLLDSNMPCPVVEIIKGIPSQTTTSFIGDVIPLTPGFAMKIDNDYLMVKRKIFVTDGERVVAMVAGEVIIGLYTRKQHTIKIDDLWIHKDKILIQGIVVGKYTDYERV